MYLKTMRWMKTTHLHTTDPSVIRIFRMFTLIRAAASTLSLLISVLVYEIRPLRIQLIDPLIFSLLTIYLSLHWLEKRLGRWYLPIALFITTALPIAQRYVLLLRETMSGSEVRSGLVRYLLETTIGLRDIQALPMEINWVPILFVPLVIIAWQYRFRMVVLFCIATFAVEIALSRLLLDSTPQGMLETGLSITGRTIAFFTVGYIVTQLAQTLREQRDALRHAYGKLVSQAAAAEAVATMQERNRLARELHDTLAHALSATSIQLEASQALWDTDLGQSRALVVKSLENTRRGLQETRHALEALRAAPLEDLGLISALRQLAEDNAQRSGWRLELELPQTMNLPLEIEQTLYRCAEEAFTNIARHAAAHVVSVKLYAAGTQLILLISDDGNGFNPTQVNSNQHFGLLGMRERVEMFHGALKVISKKGQGTSIQVIFEGLT